MSTSGHCTSLTGKAVAWFDRPDGGPSPSSRRALASKNLYGSASLAGPVAGDAPADTSFRELRFSSPNHVQRHDRGGGTNDCSDCEGHGGAYPVRNGSGFQAAKR